MHMLLKPRPLQGCLAAPPAKADAHRKLICSALADKPTLLSPAAYGEDIAATRACLQALGANIERQADGLLVHPLTKIPSAPLLDCGESGATLRFLLPLAALLSEKASFRGRGRLPERPLAELIACLENQGVCFSPGKLPFTLSGRLQGGLFELPGHISSQYLSGLLLALPLAGQDSEIHLSSPLQGPGYVELTLAALKAFSIEVQIDQASPAQPAFRIPGSQAFNSPGQLGIEGDWSNAAFFLAAGALGGPLTIYGLPMDSPQPDRAILGLLENFGAQIEQGPNSITITRGQLQGQDIDITDIPDLGPPLAILGALASGPTRLLNVGKLRLKESDRLHSLAALLSGLGGRIIMGADTLSIEGQPQLQGGQVKSYGDHRIVMAAALAACACRQDVVISGAEAVNKSYPGFFADYNSLGGLAYDVKLG